jgi:hypothetical protein
VQAGVIDFAGAAIPLVEPRRFDERETCRRALRYLAGDIDGAPSDYQTCAQYRGRRCARGGLCVFHEPDSAAIWRKASTWRLLVQPDGSTTVTPAKSATAVAAHLGAVPVEVR